MRVYVHKAAAVRGDDQVPELFIASDAIMMPSSGNEKIYEEEARLIVAALRRSLPGGTYERILAEMLRRKADDLACPEIGMGEVG